MCLYNNGSNDVLCVVKGRGGVGVMFDLLFSEGMGGG